MKCIWKLIDNLLIHVISLTGVQAYGLADYARMDCLPEYRDPRWPQPPRHRLCVV